MRRRALIAALAGLAAAPPHAHGHALFPGRQTVQTVGDRALVRLEAHNGRKDVSSFVVEVFEADRWVPSRIAVATPESLTIPTAVPGSTESTARPISVLVDLDGRAEQRIRVCTKTVSSRNVLLPGTASLATRVCVNATVRRFQP